ncbi:DUF58 domain-containing protein [Lutibacter sp. B2]|nr:DUF58 domain-containing protein [Lutibacter sp. B2]
MKITKKFIWMIGIGILFSTMAYFINLSVFTFVSYNVLCFIALMVDYFSSPNSEIVEIERIGEDKLSVYGKEKIQFSIYNKSDQEIYVEMKDEIPDFHFEVKEKMMKGSVLPHSKQIFEYEVVPKKRGAFEFGALHVRYESKLKLCMKEFIASVPREYKVYPNLKDLRKYRLALYNSKVHNMGQKPFKMFGSGAEFESLREYVAGDEYRTINWKATARENKPIVNQYEPEKNQHVYALIDTGRAMSHSVRGYKKLDVAINTGLLLADIVNQNGDQSGIMVFNTNVEKLIMPGKGNVHRNSMMEALYHVEDTNLTSNYEEAFYHLKRKERRRSLICLFTDFNTVEEAEDMMRVLPILSKNNIVMLIMMENEKTKKIAKMWANSEEEVFNKGVALEMLRERKHIINTLNKKGIMCMECPPEKLAMNVINGYLQIKNRMYF